MSKKQQSSSPSKPNYSTLFEIPFFPPLLDSYDVPAPIIIPPGSDPCLLNPNPYEDQVLETPPSLMLMDMDIDPCVVAASKSDHQSVTKTVDLTAYEHAGVSLIEPAAMMSIENVNRIVSTVIEQDTPSSVANDTLDEDSEKKKQDLSQKEAAGKSLLPCEYPKSLFVCGIPEPGRAYPKIATVEVDESLFKSPTSVQPSNSGTKDRPLHIASKQHQQNLKVSENTQIPPWTTLITSRDTTRITKSMEESKLVIGNGNTWCEICKVSCPTNTYDKQHVLGRKHIMNLRKLETIPNSPSMVIDTMTDPLEEKLKLTTGEVVNPNEGISSSCELCGVHCSSHDMPKHISGKKHQKNLKKIKQQSISSPAPMPKTQLLEPMDEESEEVFLEGSKRKGNDSLSSEEDADTKRQKMSEEEEAYCGVLVICKVCSVGFDGLMAFKTHIASFEHSTMLLKQSKGGSKGLQEML